MNTTKNINRPEFGTGQSQLPEIFDKKGVAAYLKCSTRTVENLHKRGLPYIAITSRLRRYPRAAVDEWLAERQVRRA